MGLNTKQWEFLKNVGKLIKFIENVAEIKEIEDNVTLFCTAGEIYRTEFQQKEYVRLGLSKTLHSYHLKRLAIDLNFFIDGTLTYDKEDIEIFGKYWETLNEENKWGGNFKSFEDNAHFEMSV